MIKNRNYIEPDYYIVVNSCGEVYTGMIGGAFNYSDNWSDAKPLDFQSTLYLRGTNGNELLKL
tara:strand:- start:290 stop:478 length:189 start_codon:yes stop_codon:yes gene_type:complete